MLTDEEEFEERRSGAERRDVPPSERKLLKLDELLRDITEKNRPCEWDTGPAVGEERW